MTRVVSNADPRVDQQTSVAEIEMHIKKDSKCSNATEFKYKNGSLQSWNGERESRESCINVAL